ncbi:response regulator [Halomonas alkaliantarctica]|nr:response regulator [Halomonas alkaliantarctica]
MRTEAPLTLLSVEDDSIQQQLICRMLERQGYCVVTAGSAEQGLEMLVRQSVDLILMDVNLPGMDGYTATQWLRAREKAQGKAQWHPVIIITASDTPDDWRRASECGADDYLTKPLKPHQLAAKVAIMMRLYSSYQELKHTRKMRALGQMAAGVAHDFNNILQTIDGNAEMLAEDAAGNSLLQESIEEIQRAGRRGKRLIDEMLLYVSEAPPILEPLDLASWLAEYADELQHQLPSAVSLHVSLPAHPWVRGNAGQLERVLDNLCGNAIKAIKATGHLTLETWQGRKYGGICVTDSGEGIAPDDLETIFDPFFTTRDVNEGTGLGLAVVESIIQRHGGRISVESQLGEGTTFTLSFPLTTY